MNAERLATPAAISLGGFTLALLLALSVTTLVAFGMVVVALRRRSQLNARTGLFSAAVAAAIVGSTLLVGGALTPPPTAVAAPVSTTVAPVSTTAKPVSTTVNRVSTTVNRVSTTVSQLDGQQLQTLGYDGP